MAVTRYQNRDLGSMGVWPAVEIIQGIPGHPEGAIRYPRPEQRDQWIRQGICRLIPQKRGRKKK